MDFKVAGTSEFVTALQLDTKIDGIPADVLARALQQAKEARLKILDVMRGAIAEPRSDVRPTAPKIVSFEIPIDKIGEVIGPKGKVINTLQKETGADISVTDDGVVGTVSIGSKDGEAVEEARRRIGLILDPPTAEIGAEYAGRVVNITKFGAFVNILPGRDGLLHISKLGRGKRVERVETSSPLGDEVTVGSTTSTTGQAVALSFADDDTGGGGGGSAPESRSRVVAGAPRARRAPRRRRVAAARSRTAASRRGRRRRGSNPSASSGRAQAKEVVRRPRALRGRWRAIRRRRRPAAGRRSRGRRR